MADFLTRLSARTLGTAPLARPRGQRLFDPGPVILSGPPLPGETLEASAVPRREDGRDAVPPLRPPARQAPAPLVAPEAESPPAEPRSSSAEAEPHPVREVAHGGPLRHRIDGIEPSPAPRSTAPMQEPPHAAPPELVARTSPQDPQPARPAPTLAEIGAPPPNGRSDGDREDRRIAARRDAAAAAPAIRVTIGRVEVRAIMPPPATQRPERPARTSALMSLEDHLKRGRGNP